MKTILMGLVLISFQAFAQEGGDGLNQGPYNPNYKCSFDGKLTIYLNTNGGVSATAAIYDQSRNRVRSEQLDLGGHYEINRTIMGFDLGRIVFGGSKVVIEDTAGVVISVCNRI